MIAFGYLKQGALLSLLFFWLTACTSSGPALNPPPETLPSTTVSPPPARADEVRTREALSKNKLEESDRIAHEAKGVAAPSAIGVMGVPHDLRYPSEPLNRENYAHFDDNPVKRAAEQPVSTFSIDVDTGAYANVRRFLNQGSLPVQDAVRVEEMINYFSYDYPLPKDKTRPFSVTTEIAPTPWSKDTVLLRVGLKGYDIAAEKLPPANLVFLVDVSGSMMSPDKLPLLKSGLKLLVQNLRAQDRVSLVVYAGNTGVVLEPTPGDGETKELFTEAFNAIQEKFREVFSLLFEGGKAELVLLDETDILESGIEIIAQPRGKKFQAISLLSGGERALTAIALLFAAFLVKPSPFCMLDEVDAPLDDANVTRFTRLIREMSNRSQFITITHNKRTMEMADALYGITMEEPGCSRVVSVKLREEAMA